MSLVFCTLVGGMLLLSHDLASRLVLGGLFVLGLFVGLTVGHGFLYVFEVIEVAQRLWRRLTWRGR